MEESRTSTDGDLRRAWASLRLSQWWHFLPLALASIVPGARAHPQAALIRGLVTLSAVALCLGYAYGINAIMDRGGDRDGRKNPLMGITALPVAVPVVVFSCAGLALSLGATLGLVSAGWTAISVLASTLYSAGPRLKALPFVNTATNALIFVPLLGVGASEAAAPMPIPILMLAFGALLTQNQLLHEIADSEEDLASGARTSAVLLGASRTFRLAVAVALVSGVGLYALGTPALPARIAAVLVALPSPWVARSTPASAGRMRWIHRVYSLVAGACIFAAVLYERGLR